MLIANQILYLYLKYLKKKFLHENYSIKNIHLRIELLFKLKKNIYKISPKHLLFFPPFKDEA